MSEILNNLEKNGYITRLEAKNDSRRKIINLTDKSREVVSLLKKNFKQIAHKVIDNIPNEEYEMFKMVLDKMERNIDKLC